MVTKKILTILAVIMLLGTNSVWAYPNWDIYSDAVIKEGDIYNFVSVYDTPPDHTTVDMLGGKVDWIRSYDASIINITAGDISVVHAYEFSVANISGGIIDYANANDHGTVNILNNGDVFSSTAFSFGTINVMGGNVHDWLYSWNSSIINFYGGIIHGVLGAEDTGTINLYSGVVDHMSAGDRSVVNVFGYDLVKTSIGGRYGYGQVYGFFTNGSPFIIDLSNSETYSHINLIPEPATFLLLGLGGIFIKKRH